MRCDSLPRCQLVSHVPCLPIYHLLTLCLYGDIAWDPFSSLQSPQVSQAPRPRSLDHAVFWIQIPYSHLHPEPSFMLLSETRPKPEPVQAQSPHGSQTSWVGVYGKAAERPGTARGARRPQGPIRSFL